MDPQKWRQIKEIEKCSSWAEEVLDLQTLEYALKFSTDPDHPDWEFLGRKLSKDVARKIAEG